MKPVLYENERLDEINENLRLIQRKNGLTFSTDAFLLSAFCHPAPRDRAADFGCGTGVIALLLAARKVFAHITAVEAQEIFAELAARNAQLNGFSDTVSVLFRDVRDLSPADFGGELDVIVSNPPYMRAGDGPASPHNEKQIARHEILGTIHDFCAAAARILRWLPKPCSISGKSRLWRAAGAAARSFSAAAPWGANIAKTAPSALPPPGSLWTAPPCGS